MSAETEMKSDLTFEFTDYLTSEKEVLGFLKEGLTKEVLSNYTRFSEEVQLPYFAMLKITGNDELAEIRLTGMISGVIAELEYNEVPGPAMINEVIQSLHQRTIQSSNASSHI